MRILGIDPGTTRIGYGLIEKGREFSLVDYGIIEINSANKHAGITELGARMDALIARSRPDISGVEQLFFSKNQKTALAVAQARGIILNKLLTARIPVFECTPNQVKQTVAGFGNADKRAVAAMVRKLLRIETLSGHDDASDALAIAITAAYHYAFAQKTGGTL